MRVLQLHTRYRELGGEDVVVDAEAAMLRDDGHEIEQFIADNPSSASRAVGSLALAPWNPFQAARLRGAIRAFKPDVAHVHNTWFAMSPSVIAALAGAGVPIVMTLHNYRLVCANAMLYRDGQPCEDCVGASPWQGVRHACYRGSRALSSAMVATTSLHRRLGTWDRVHTYIVLTEFQRDLMIRGGIPADRIAVKPNSVLDPGSRPSPPSLSRTVLYAGRLTEEKGVDLMLDAWGEAHPQDLELVVVGDGPLRSKLEAKASRLSSIRFEGHLSHDAVLTAMLRARALLFPSRGYEGLPLTLLEAFAAALPVMASDVGAAGATVAPLGPEWLVPLEDSLAGWRRGVRALASRLDIDAASRRAREQYSERYRPAATVPHLLRILEGATVR